MDDAMQMAEAARGPAAHLPSLGQLLFQGEFAAHLLFPFPEQSTGEKEACDSFVEELKIYLEQHLDPDQVDATRLIPPNVVDALVKMGIFAMKIPKSYGGLGFSQVSYNKVMMLIASYCASTAVLVSAHQSIGVPKA